MQGLEFKYDATKYKLADFLDKSLQEGHFKLTLKKAYLVCTQCKQVKHKTFRFFPRDATKSDGMRKTCKVCVNFNQLVKRFKSEDISEVIRKLDFFIDNPNLANFKFDYKQYLELLKENDIHPTFYFRYKEEILTQYFIQQFKSSLKSRRQALQNRAIQTP